MSLAYAASLRNPPKGYGSIDAGIRVLKYRSERLDHYNGLGYDYAAAAVAAERDVLAMYGEPFYSVDEDGIPV